MTVCFFPLRPLALAVVSSMALGSAVAQTAPDAGRVFRESAPEIQTPTRQSAPGVRAAEPAPAPTPAAQGAPDIAIKGVRLSGQTVFSEAELLALVADLPGSVRSLAQLQQAAARITRRYRDAGYLVARAYLPQQKLDEGVLQIAVLEGQLGEIKVSNTSRLMDARVQAFLDQIPRDTPPQRERLDRPVLLLGDVPGVGSVQARLAAGEKPGETVLNVGSSESPLVQGRLEADNHGGLYTGRARLGASLNLNSALGWGERLSARWLSSDADLISGRLAAQVPLGSDGLSASAALGRTTYRLGDTFEALDARGQSDTQELALRYPLRRSMAGNVYALVALERRDLRDEVRSTETVSDKRANVRSLQLSGDWRDGWLLGGLTLASVGHTSGTLRLLSPDAAEIDAVAAHTAGGFNKWSWALERQQALTRGVTLVAAVRGQQAGNNLDSSEKFSLGGASGVRAYASGEASGDEGWLASLELRYALTSALIASVFHDTGKVSVNVKPYLDTPNTLRRSGTGLGLQGWIGAMDWRVYLAWRGSQEGSAEPDRKLRVWASAGWRF